MDKKKRKSQLDVIQLEERVADLEGKWKRTLADYDNLRKRVERERGDLVKLASASLLDKLLAVLDDLERVEAHLKDKGLSLAMKQFRQVLATEEVEEIEALGKEFDPELMDCTEIVKGKENVVVEVCQKGYRLAGRVIRPAKVKVGKGKK
jgi:molecular chaperone GrpE